MQKPTVNRILLTIFIVYFYLFFKNFRMSVSRSLRPLGEPNRPPDWFSQKNCAVQYSVLLETVETPKRKKRSEKGEVRVETPGENIVRRLTHGNKRKQKE